MSDPLGYSCIETFAGDNRLGEKKCARVPYILRLRAHESRLRRETFPQLFAFLNESVLELLVKPA